MIRTAREARGISQDDLSRQLPGKGSGNQVAKWERGENRPSEERLAALIQELGLDADEAREAFLRFHLERAEIAAKRSQKRRGS